MTKLFPYQQKGVRKIDHFKGRALLADEMGLGKTIQALTWVAGNRERLPAVVVCPAHLKLNWAAEIQKHSRLSCIILNGTKSKEFRKPDVTIINYDILQNWFPHLIGAETLIIDEAHFCKSRTTKRTKFTKELSKKIPYLIGISGTPLTNRPAELYPILNMLFPRVYSSFWEFAKRHCHLYKSKWGWKFEGAKNLPELHQKLKKSCMIRRRKKDVLTDLPDKIRTICPVVLEPKRSVEYEKAKRTFIQWLREQSPEKAMRASRAEAITKIGYLKRIAAEGKLKTIIEWISDFLEESEGKLVVFGVHKEFLKEIHKTFHRQAVLITGNVSYANREKAVALFQQSKNIRLFVGNIQAAGTGITLTTSSDLLFAEMAWTPGEHLQAEDRIHRIGQKGSVNITYIVAKNTIEELFVEILQKKFGVLDEILDGGDSVRDFDIFAQLQKALLKK